MNEKTKLKILYYINKTLARFGYSITPKVPYFKVFNNQILINSFNLGAPFTMIGEARLWSLIDSVRYISENEVPGDIVECGVWKG
jgi:O-methyltransferase